MLKQVVAGLLIVVAMATEMAAYADVPIVLKQEASVPIPSSPDSKLSSAEQYMIQQSLTEAELTLAKQVKKEPRSDQVRFALGMVQFLRAVEQGVQDLYKYGFRLPIAEVPVPTNP